MMINIKIMRKFIKLALKNLEGDFVIIGGTVLYLANIDVRITMDIECIGLDDQGMDATLKMMEIAEKLGLPVESINQAGAYFLQKIPDFKKHLLLVEKSDVCTIYRPDLQLFLQLKMSRLSETDFSDCLKYIEHEMPTQSQAQIAHIVKILQTHLEKTTNSVHRDYLKKMISRIRDNG